MNRLESASAELRVWGRGGGPWPRTGKGLLDIVATGFADWGVQLDVASAEPSAAYLGEFFEAARLFAESDLDSASAARLRAGAQNARRPISYHLGNIARVTEHFGSLSSAWDAGGGPTIRISFAELTSHLATSFGLHGRTPHCGEAGRDLLPGAAEHIGPEQFVPERPFFRYAGDCMAEVTLNFGTPIFVDTTDDSVSPAIVRTGWWEPWTDGLVRKCLGPGDVAVNVGANVGYYTLLAAKRVQSKGRVFSFEPNPRLALLIMRSLRWGGLLGIVRIHQMALSDRAGTASFAADRHYMGAGTLVDSEHATRLSAATPKEVLSATFPQKTLLEVHDVETARLDDVIGSEVRDIHFMLIDTEGAEALVLAGSEQLIRRSRDLAMVVEWSGAKVAKAKGRAAVAEEAVQRLAGDNFKFWLIEPDLRDAYARPAVLTPMTPDQVIAMERYADLFVCRQETRARFA